MTEDPRLRRLEGRLTLIEMRLTELYGRDPDELLMAEVVVCGHLEEARTALLEELASLTED